MGWATDYIRQLKEGITVKFRPRGQSMKPKINSGELCTVVPVGEGGLDPATLQKGDIVLCKVGGSEYLHLISAIQGPRFQISNNHGHVNGWVTAGNVFGKCISVEA